METYRRSHPVGYPDLVGEMATHSFAIGNMATARLHSSYLFLRHAVFLVGLSGLGIVGFAESLGLRKTRNIRSRHARPDHAGRDIHRLPVSVKGTNTFFPCTKVDSRTGPEISQDETTRWTASIAKSLGEARYNLGRLHVS